MVSLRAWLEDTLRVSSRDNSKEEAEWMSISEAFCMFESTGVSAGYIDASGFCWKIIDINNI